MHIEAKASDKDMLMFFKNLHRTSSHFKPRYKNGGNCKTDLLSYLYFPPSIWYNYSRKDDAYAYRYRNCPKSTLKTD